MDEYWPTEKVIAEIDRLVRPWFDGHAYSWRTDEQGIPLEDDLIVAISCLRSQRRLELDLRVSWRGVTCYVSEERCGTEYEDYSFREALCRMLLDDLQRTCVTCRYHDGHDSTCALASEEAAL